jgi:hypothetical protein
MHFLRFYKSDKHLGGGGGLNQLKTLDTALLHIHLLLYLKLSARYQELRELPPHRLPLINRQSIAYIKYIT